MAKIASCSNPDYQLEIGKEVLSIDEKYFRPTEVDLLNWRRLQKQSKSLDGNLKLL